MLNRASGVAHWQRVPQKGSVSRSRAMDSRLAYGRSTVLSNRREHSLRRAEQGVLCNFFFQAEDGIRDKLVTGVQTCALPICTRVRRLDARRKSTGTAEFGMDVKVPGMLTALIARSPVFGGKVAKFDATKAKAVPGVRHVVQVSSGVAVVANGYWPAKTGREALEVSWDEGANASVTSAGISQLFARQAEKTGAVARHDGDADGQLAGAATKVDAVYEAPFLAHATMEPMNATAHVR